MSITRDQGFFKDNIVIHSTQGFPFGFGSNKECFIKSFKPCILASKDLIYYLDDVFYKYFKHLEKKFIYHSEDNKSEDFSNNRKPGDSDISEQEIYILMIQKKVLKRNFLEKFEFRNDDEKIFKNCFILKLREIDISFRDMVSFDLFTNVISFIFF